MPTTSLPSINILPLVGSSKPAIIRRVVVLPEPDGPSIEKNSPSYTSRSTPATATTGNVPLESTTFATRRPWSSSPKRLTTPSRRTATVRDPISGTGGDAGLGTGGVTGSAADSRCSVGIAKQALGTGSGSDGRAVEQSPHCAVRIRACQ